MKLFAPVLAVLLCVGCGDDDSKPTAPSHELVGTWAFVSTDLADAFVEPLLQSYKDAGFQGETLAALTAELEAIEDELNEEFQEVFIRLRIKDGGQWEDSTGDMGTWEVDGNLLTFSRDNNDELDKLNTRYFLSTNELVLNFGLLESLEFDDEDFDDEAREVFIATFAEDASFQIIFRRVE